MAENIVAFCGTSYSLKQSQVAIVVQQKNYWQAIIINDLQQQKFIPIWCKVCTHCRVLLSDMGTPIKDWSIGRPSSSRRGDVINFPEPTVGTIVWHSDFHNSYCCLNHRFSKNISIWKIIKEKRTVDLGSIVFEKLKWELAFSRISTWAYYIKQGKRPSLSLKFIGPDDRLWDKSFKVQ